MYVCSLQELIIRLFLGQETLGEGVRDLGRLFHDVTEISRQRHRALAVCFQLAQWSRHRRLDVQRRAACDVSALRTRHVMLNGCLTFAYLIIDTNSINCHNSSMYAEII